MAEIGNSSGSLRSFILLFSVLLLVLIILPMVVAADEGELDDDGGYHHSLLLLAAFAGLLSALTGMRNSRIKAISKWFPKEVPRILHRWLSVLYYLVFFGTFLLWSVTFYNDEGQIYFTLHGQLGLLSFLLAIVGIVTGLAMWKRPARWWKYHWVFNMASYLLMLAAIVTGSALGD